MKKLFMTIITTVVAAFAAAPVYDIELSYNDNFFAQEAIQTFVAISDSISEAAFFCGRKVIPGKYRFILEDSTGMPLTEDWAYSDSSGLFDYERVPAVFSPKVYVRKGFKYRLHVSRADTFKTNFYYNSNDPYAGGELIGHAGCDLAARIKGVNEDDQMPKCQKCLDA